MPPKKAATATPKKAAANPAHASYKGTSQRFLVHQRSQTELDNGLPGSRITADSIVQI